MRGAWATLCFISLVGLGHADHPLKTTIRECVNDPGVECPREVTCRRSYLNCITSPNDSRCQGFLQRCSLPECAPFLFPSSYGVARAQQFLEKPSPEESRVSCPTLNQCVLLVDCSKFPANPVVCTGELMKCQLETCVPHESCVRCHAHPQCSINEMAADCQIDSTCQTPCELTPNCRLEESDPDCSVDHWRCRLDPGIRGEDCSTAEECCDTNPQCARETYRDCDEAPRKIPETNPLNKHLFTLKSDILHGQQELIDLVNDSLLGMPGTRSSTNFSRVLINDMLRTTREDPQYKPLPREPYFTDMRQLGRCSNHVSQSSCVEEANCGWCDLLADENGINEAPAYVRLFLLGDSTEAETGYCMPTSAYSTSVCQRFNRVLVPMAVRIQLSGAYAPTRTEMFDCFRQPSEECSGRCATAYIPDGYGMIYGDEVDDEERPPEVLVCLPAAFLVPDTEYRAAYIYNLLTTRKLNLIYDSYDVNGGQFYQESELSLSLLRSGVEELNDIYESRTFDVGRYPWLKNFDPWRRRFRI